ncbi:long-chain fatty acid--CoA ligase [Isoptericola sp. NPDC019482]|uniref:acyl-CoA synthetase n=1 Tax=Isoptericola sp. NPDC019482 TaxID=3154688 RepID=UPI0034860EA7
MRDLGVGSWPRRRLKNGADRTAISFGDTALSYADVERRTRRLANALRAAGVGRGDRVAYVGFNHPSLLETFFATAQLGAIWVVVNARLAAEEVAYVLGDCGAGVVVHGPEHDELVRRIAPGLPAVRAWVGVGPPGTAGPYEELIAAAGEEEVDEPVTWDDPALIMYTSGTTGRPKGAVHTHGSLSFQYFSVLVDTDVAHDDVALAFAPLFHVAGLNMLVMPTFLKGGRIVLQQQFRPEAVLRAIAGERATSMFAVPTMLDLLARHELFPATDVSSLRNVVVGGSPLPDRTLRAWADRGVPIEQGYGMTETAPGVFLLTAADAERKHGSAGRPHFWVEGRVVRADGGDVAPGEIGEVVAQGPNVMAGYWEDPGATDAALVDGWYRTGDLATVDDDGYVYVRDRLKDMYISGGENVYPAEVENALLEVPGVAEAAVVGVPDERWGEVGCAFVVLSDDAGLAPEDVEAHVRDALADRLARYKIPRHVVVRPELPRTATGKLRKHVLRQRFEEAP